MSRYVNCVVVRRGTFTPHRECPALRIVSGRQVQLLPDRRREGYAAVSDFRGCPSFVRPQDQGWGCRRVGTPGLSQRLSSKSMAISETPILCHIITTHLYSRIYAIRPRTGVAENRQNVRNPPPLSSAPFCIRLVIRDFSKTAEDRSSADTAISPPCGHPPWPHRESEPLSHEFRALFPGESA